MAPVIKAQLRAATRERNEIATTTATKGGNIELQCPCPALASSVNGPVGRIDRRAQKKPKLARQNTQRGFEIQRFGRAVIM